MIDNLDLFEMHEREMTKHATKLPTCDWCGETIWDDRCHKIGGELVCKACIDDTEVSTDNFIYE